VELKHASLAKSFASDDYHVHDLSHMLPVRINIVVLVCECMPSITSSRVCLQEGTLLPNTSYVFRVNLFYGEVKVLYSVL
jgi:hypothetical protein